MKVVHIASRSFNEIGGIEEYLKNICPQLVRIGYNVCVYTGVNKKDNNSNYKGVNIIQVKTPKNKFFGKIYLGVYATIHSILKNGTKGIIYHYHANAASILSFLPRYLGANVIFHGHGFEWKRAKWSTKMQKIIKALDWFVIKSNKNILMVSEEQSNYTRKFFKKNCTTITSGVDLPTLYGSNDSNILTKYNLESGKFILFLARLVPEKKAEILIESFLDSTIFDEIKLVIAGDNPFEKDYIDKLKSMSNDVIFTGSVFGKDKACLLRHCKAFCIPSELEGLPITLLEAMSYNKLCIASDIDANKEALGNDGVYFKTNNIKDLSEKLSNIDTFSAFNPNVRVKELFTWERKVTEFDNYYKSLHKNNTLET